MKMENEVQMNAIQDPTNNETTSADVSKSNENPLKKIKHVAKGWGYERWIVNCSEYCGKLLYFEKGKKCSWHYHKIKDEVFYLQSGKMLVKYSDFDDLETSNEVLLTPGDAFHVYRGLRHQMIALEDSELFEFSTQHFDSDSFRIVKGD